MKRTAGLVVAACAVVIMFAGCGDDDETSNGPVVGTLVQTDLTGTEWIISYHYNTIHPEPGWETNFEYPILFHANNVLEIRPSTGAPSSNHQYVVYNGTNVVMAVTGSDISSGTTFRGALTDDWHMSGWGYRTMNSLCWTWIATRVR